MSSTIKVLAIALAMTAAPAAFAQESGNSAGFGATENASGNAKWMSVGVTTGAAVVIGAAIAAATDDDNAGSGTSTGTSATGTSTATSTN
ncbi:hypothetical protein RM530_02465 [Algiphilus sp. W345]|uniref:Uncharacterized protein n=1 Tax=Banduia mediterranea TaxID=3075609 RepID=A0ABU2WEE7_9GAMM|nr:hypothetical protein [Algiphilus sp. W345]MDT0496230.1 hypothetical protein [Algiphilus sp. W345]